MGCEWLRFIPRDRVCFVDSGQSFGLCLLFLGLMSGAWSLRVFWCATCALYLIPLFAIVPRLFFLSRSERKEISFVIRMG